MSNHRTCIQWSRGVALVFSLLAAAACDGSKSSDSKDSADEQASTRSGSNAVGVPGGVVATSGISTAAGSGSQGGSPSYNDAFPPSMPAATGRVGSFIGQEECSLEGFYIAAEGDDAYLVPDAPLPAELRIAGAKVEIRYVERRLTAAEKGCQVNGAGLIGITIKDIKRAF